MGWKLNRTLIVKPFIIESIFYLHISITFILDPGLNRQNEIDDQTFYFRFYLFTLSNILFQVA